MQMNGEAAYKCLGEMGCIHFVVVTKEHSLNSTLQYRGNFAFSEKNPVGQLFPTGRQRKIDVT